MEAVPTTSELETLLAESEWVSRLALGLAGDPQRAEDLSQETWLAALRRPPTRGDSARPWLATVARNFARSERRDAGARRDRETARAREARGDASPPPEELLERLETQEALSRLVRELPPELSEVVVLTFYEGRSSAWIARQRGLPAATVRARKQRALEVLRERLDARHGGDRQAWLTALAPLAATATRRAAEAAAGGGLLAGLLAPWIAMSLTLKLATLAVLPLLAALLLFTRGDQTAAPQPGAGIPAREEVALAPSPAAPAEPGPAPVELPGERSPAPAIAADADPDAPPITRVRLRVVDGFGRPVSGAAVRPSPSYELQRSHAYLEEELGPLGMLALAAEMLRRTGADGVAAWETNLLREAGLMDFEVTGPNYETGTLRVDLEPGMDEELGEVVLEAAGAVTGRVRTAEGSDPGRVIVELGPAQLPEQERARTALSEDGPEPGVGYDHTTEDGRFRVQGIPPGEYRAYAHRFGAGPGGWSEPFAVTAGFEVEDVEIELEPGLGSPAELVVLGANGEPLSTAQVWIEAGGLRMNSRVGTDAAYLFSNYELLVGGRVEVSDRALRHRPATIDPLPLEPQRLVVRLEAASTVERTLRIVDGDGAPVPEGAVSLARGRDSLETPFADGAVELVLPATSEGAFDLSIRATGHASALQTELTGDGLPEDWTVALERLPGIAGVVLADGEPVERARVKLCRLQAKSEPLVYGTAITLLNSPLAEARTDSDGAFLVAGDWDGDFALLVSGRGAADAVLELPGFVAAEGAAELVVELDPGGTVQGTVLDHTGLTVAGANVALHHPLLGLRTTRSRKDGSYRLRRVPAGDWYLRSVEELDEGIFSMHINVAEDWVYPSNCVVVAGGETLADIVLPDPAGAEIAGHIEFSGIEVGGVSVEIATAGTGLWRGRPFHEDWEETVDLDPDGTFRVPLRAGRDYDLYLACPELAAELRREVPAAQLPAWIEAEFELARLTFTRTGDPPAEFGSRNVYVGWDGPGWALDAWLSPALDGSPAPVLVPAGELELSWTGADGELHSEQIRLGRGEERAVILD